MLAVLSLKAQHLIKSRQPNFLMQFTNWGPTKGRLYFMAYEQQDRYFSKSADSGNFVESAQMNLEKKWSILLPAYTTAFTVLTPQSCMYDAYDWLYRM